MGLLDKVDWPKPGKYVLAVSGGVDSMVMLHLLAGSGKEYKLIVSHVDHGWRYDSAQDHKLVESLAQDLGLPFESIKLDLKNKSEAAAREARYDFLRKTLDKHDARAVITAHHWDDRQETSLFNLLRGTNRYGLAPLKSTPEILRPLLGIRKSELCAYANQQNLSWREDTTNVDTSYSRNFIRHELLPFARQQDQNFDREYNQMLVEADRLNEQIDDMIKKILVQNAQTTAKNISISDKLTAQLSLPVLRHVILAMARRLDAGAEIDSLALDQAALQLKTGRLKRPRALSRQLNVQVGRDTVAVALI